MSSDSETEFHPLIRRQLRKLGLGPEGIPSPDAWRKLLHAVGRSYEAAEQDRYLIERSLEVSSQEMQSLYRDLEAASESRLATERDRLQSVLGAVSDCILAFSATGELRFLNRTAQSLLGAPTDLQAFSERMLLRDTHGNILTLQSNLVREVQDSGKTREAIGTFDRLGQDDEVDIACIVSPMREGTSVGVVVVVRDMRQRIRERKMLIDALSSAEEALKVRADFIATMSHEIRTPMNGVIGTAGLLGESNLSEAQQELVSTIRSSGEALLAIINDILDFSKLEAGKVTIEEVRYDPVEIAEQAVHVVAESADKKRLDLAVVVGEDVPGSLVGDPGRVRQVLLNLLTNAVKFTSRGSIRVDLRAENGRLVFRVTDTGIGFEPAHMERLFQPFTQADASTTRQYGGTGLGLAICQQLAHAMGGSLIAEGSPGEGSSFALDVPVEDPLPPQLVLQGTVAVVGMSPLQTESVRSILKRFGFEIVPREKARVCVTGSAIVADPTELRSIVSLVPIYDKDAEWARGTHRVKLPLRSTPFARSVRGAQGRRRSQSVSRVLNDDTDLEGVKVLVVEDNPVNQLVARRMLEHLGMRCDVVGNGDEAIEVLDRIPYDIVLMDIQMPGLDGYATTRELRKRGMEALPVVAMTANALDEDVARCLRAGMNGHIAKPVTLPALRRAVRKHVLRNTKSTAPAAI